MAAWFDGVTVFVEVAWDDAPLTAVGSCTWTDETAFARFGSGINISRGRRSELSPVGPGSMTIQFDNRTRRYDVANTAGGLYTKLLPMRHIRVYTVRAGVTRYLFTGYILGFPITYPGMTDSVVTVECVDAYRVLQQSELPGSAYARSMADTGAAYYWPMQEPDFDRITATIGDTDLTRRSNVDGVVANAGLPLGEPSALVGAATAAGTSGQLGIIPLPVAVEMWVSPATDVTLASFVYRKSFTNNEDFLRIQPASSYVTVGFSYYLNLRDSTGAGVTFTYPRTYTTPYHLTVTVSGTTITVLVNGVSIGTDTLAAGSYALATQTGANFVFTGADATAISHVAAYTGLGNDAVVAAAARSHWLSGVYPYGHPTGERTGTRAGRLLDAVSWASADRGLSSGETFCGDWLPESATALAALRELESSEQGLLFMSADGKVTLRDRQWFMTATNAVTPVATFGDTGSDVPYRAVKVDGNQIDFVRNTVTLTYPGGTVSIKDATSVTAYGAQSDAVDANAMPAHASWLARNLAKWRLRLRKDPATRVPSITIPMRKDMATCYPIAALELGDRVVVNRTPSGGAGTISVKCTVQGIDHQITGDDWTVGLYLAPAVKTYLEAPYLVANPQGSIYTPAATVSYLSIPDAAAFTPTTTLDIRTVINQDDWTPAANRVLCGHFLAAGNLRAWRVLLSTGGFLILQNSADGTAVASTTSSVTLASATTLVDATTKIAVRALWTAATPDVKFYYKVLTSSAYAEALSDSGWTQLGTTVTVGVSASIFNSTVALAVAGDLTAGSNGYCYATVVKVDGTLQAGFDADQDITSAAASTLTLTSGQTATVTLSTLVQSNPTARIGTTAANLVAA